MYSTTIQCVQANKRRARLDKKGESVQARFLYFCGHYLTGVYFHFFKHTPGQNLIEYLYLTLNQPPTAPPSHFPQSQTNPIPKPFLPSISFSIHPHFLIIQPNSPLFPTNSISFQPHSFSL